MPADLDRQPFYCPYPGCKRKFASLWRLKVHYRAPPNERGSGKERGHGVELPICPACGEELEPGKHHNKCKAGRTTNPPSKRIPKSSNAAPRQSKQRKTAHEPDRKPVQPVEDPLENYLHDEPGSPGYGNQDMPLFARHGTNGGGMLSGMEPSGSMDAPGAQQSYQPQYVQPTAGFPAFDFGFFNGPPGGSSPMGGHHHMLQRGGSMLDMPHLSEAMQPAEMHLGAGSGDMLGLGGHNAQDHSAMIKAEHHEGPHGGAHNPHGGPHNPHGGAHNPHGGGGHNPHGGPLHKDPSLSAQAAAEVLFGITRPDGEPDDNQPRMLFSHAPFMMPISVGADGMQSVMHSGAMHDGGMLDIGQHGQHHRAPGSPMQQQHAHESEQQHGHSQHNNAATYGHHVSGVPVHGMMEAAEGVPVDGFGQGGMPMMVQWPLHGMNAQGMSGVMMMTPQGLMSVMGTSPSGCPILMPVSMLEGGKLGDGSAVGGEHMHVVSGMPQFGGPDGGMLQGGLLPHMVAMQADGTPQFVPSNHYPGDDMMQHVQMVHFQQHPAEHGGHQEAPQCSVVGIPLSAPVDAAGVSAEDWRDSVKNVQLRFQDGVTDHLPEVSATS